MFGTVTRLLENPDLVASTWLNLASATWFYAYPQPPKPSMLHVIDGTWQPNKGDMKNRLEPGFGATIMIINGGIECGHGSEKPQALHRQAYYRKFAEYFKVNCLTMLKLVVQNGLDVRFMLYAFIGYFLGDIFNLIRNNMLFGDSTKDNAVT